MSLPITLDEAEVTSVRTVQLTRVTFPRGSGTGPGHTHREVEQYWDADGKLVFEVDHYQDEAARLALDEVLRCGWNVLRKDAPGYHELKPFNEAMNAYQRFRED